jgi:HCOMODA/2-hydroxy-3-carboxy-muconic semialdehyde decarboxylase
VRTPALGQALAAVLGNHTVVLMRGHGSVAVGDSLPQVVFRAVYTETNARLQADAMRLGPVTYLDAEEARLSAQTNAGVIGRAWELWKKKALSAN